MHFNKNVQILFFQQRFSRKYAQNFSSSSESSFVANILGAQYNSHLFSVVSRLGPYSYL